jgi:hypothetical protein
MQNEAPPPVFGPSAYDHDVIDALSLSKGIDHLCCQACSENHMDEGVKSFFTFYKQQFDVTKGDERRRPMLKDCLEEFKINKLSTSCLSSVSMQSETVGFATSTCLHFQYKDSMHKVSIEPQKVSANYFDGYANKDCNSLYWVNYLVVMFMHQIGCGMYHTQQPFAVFLGLPSFFQIPYIILDLYFKK